MNKYKNVIFDLGGVLINWDPRYLYKDVFNDDTKMEHFLTHICNSEWNERFDLGYPMATAVKELCAKHPEHSQFIKLYGERWQETLGDPIHGTVAILRELKIKQINVYALTNWSDETFPYAKQKYSFLNEFLDIVVSGEEKMIKPDQKIYELLLKRNNLNAHESVFVDDRLVNIQGAENLGIKGIHFSAPEKLRTELKELGFVMK
jgi:2-haloacid dehalogenase